MSVLTENGWGRVTVVGCGLIGASFALALRRAGACARVAGWDASPSVLDEALTRGIIDEVDDAFADGGVSESDLVYLATPVGAIIEFLRERASQIKPGAVVTDAGSTKREVCRAARECVAARPPLRRRAPRRGQPPARPRARARRPVRRGALRVDG